MVAWYSRLRQWKGLRIGGKTLPALLNEGEVCCERDTTRGHWNRRMSLEVGQSLRGEVASGWSLGANCCYHLDPGRMVNTCIYMDMDMCMCYHWAR